MILLYIIPLMLLVSSVYFWRQHLQQFKPYAKQVDDVFYVSCHPITGEPVNIPSLYKVLVSVPHQEVFARAEHHEEMLKKSGNLYFENPELKENGYANRQIGVYKIPFQEGKNCNENWDKEYHQRIKNLVDRIRIPKHYKMKTENEEFYNEHQLNQTFTWEKN